MKNIDAETIKKVIAMLLDCPHKQGFKAKKECNEYYNCTQCWSDIS